MKRRPLRAIALLLAGASATILVAWACVLWGPIPNRLIGQPIALSRFPWPEPPPLGWPPEADRRTIESTSTMRRTTVFVRHVTPHQGVIHMHGGWQTWSMVRHAAGWPFRCVEFREGWNVAVFTHEEWASWALQTPPWLLDHVAPPSTSTNNRNWYLDADRADYERSFRDRLPLCPLVPAFLASTILYAFLLGCLAAFPGWCRRRLRLRRNLCPHCAYDLAATPAGPCPECGRSRKNPHLHG